jgi:hypothetical protein
MRLIELSRVGGLIAVSAVMLLSGSLSGCSQEKQTPVGEVLEYDPANDPTVSAAEEYMEKEEPGMGP